MGQGPYFLASLCVGCQAVFVSGREKKDDSERTLCFSLQEMAVQVACAQLVHVCVLNCYVCSVCAACVCVAASSQCPGIFALVSSLSSNGRH